MGNSAIDEGYILLMIAMLREAKADYRIYLQVLKINPKNEAAKQEIEKIEEFIRGQLVSAMLDIEPETILREFRKGF